MTDYTLEIFEPGDARVRLRQASETVNARIDDYARALRHAADAEGIYRVELAHAFRSEREGGAAVAEAEIKARAAAVLQSKERDEAAGEAKAAGERVQAALDARRSLWRLIEWSMRASTGTGRTEDERASWPS